MKKNPMIGRERKLSPAPAGPGRRGAVITELLALLTGEACGRGREEGIIAWRITALMHSHSHARARAHTKKHTHNTIITLNCINCANRCTHTRQEKRQEET